MNHGKKQFWLVATLILFAVLSRFFPHAYNFTPIVAIALFAGAYLDKKYALIAPLGAMFISDAFIGFYDWKVMAVVYGSFACAGLLGLLLKGRVRASTVLLSSLSASIVFYLATNTAVWFWGGMYSLDLSGLFSSLVAGIPFFRNMIIGDLWFSALIFGSYELVGLLIYKFLQNRRPTVFNTSEVEI